MRPTPSSSRVIGSRATSSTIRRITTTAARVETYANGKAGKAGRDRHDERIDIADSSSFDVADLTIEAWISPSTIPTGTNRAGILDCDGQYGFFLHRMATWSAPPAAA